MALLENLNIDEKELNSQSAASHPDEREKTEIIEPAVQEKNVRLTTFILLAAIAVVLAAIWLIHKKAAPAQTIAGDQQLQIETAIAQLTGISTENVDQVDQLVKKFYEFTDFGQVSPKQFRRNPFSSSSIASETADSLALKENNSDVKSNAQKMQLQSILQSKYGNCCMIDDALLYKGDKINGFEIVEIGADFVRLRTGGQDMTLYLQTE
jgi:hypothetical protein